MLLIEYFALFLIIALGFLLGRIKIKGISLDVSAIIFVAIIFGYYGVKISPILQQIGLILFIYTVGLQAGPGFLATFRKNGVQLMVFAIILISLASVATIILGYLFNIDKPVLVGIFSGALTSTPGLAVAIDTTKSTLVPIGYGVAYPIGVLGVVLFIRLFPKLIGASIKKAEEQIESEIKYNNPEILNKNYIVRNEHIFGNTIGELKIRSMTGANISRVLKDQEAFTPSSDTILNENDLVKAVGTSESLKKFEILIGPHTTREMPLNKNYEIQSILVTNKNVVNKTIRELNLWHNYNATITRITRSGIIITPTPNLHLRFGDKLTVACNKEDMQNISHILGNDDKRLSDTDIFPVAVGILIGILVGKITISFSDSFSFSLGLTGGILLSGIILGNLGKTGPFIWTMSGTANILLRQLGLIFFLASIGTNAGSQIVETLKNYGSSVFIIALIITFVPMIITTFIAFYVFKFNVLILSGTLAGSMTSTPGLAAAASFSNNNSSQVAYATVYPIAMVFLIICIQIMTVIL